MTTSTERLPFLQPRSARIEAPGPGHDGRPGYLPATPSTVLWGRLPCADDSPVLSIDPGQSLWVDTVSHEGILDDQGRDPVAFFTGHGIPAGDVLHDAVRVAVEVSRDPVADGPHVVTGPIEVRGARVGDVLSITVLALEMRAGYGIVSNRHGRGALPAEFPVGGALDPVSILCTVDPVAPGGPLTGSMAVGPGDGRRVGFPIRPFLGTMGVAVAGVELSLAAPKTVTSTARPTDAPTCWATLIRPEAAPASLASTACRPADVRGTKATPLPAPSRMSGPSTLR